VALVATPAAVDAWHEIREYCYDDPVLFVRTVIGASPDPWQAEVMNRFMETKRAVIAGCNGAGKDTLVTWMALFLMCTRVGLKGQVTGPNKNQVNDTLWVEFKKWIDHSSILHYLLDWQKTHIYWREDHGWFLAARTTAKRYSRSTGDAQAEGIQGMHHKHVFIAITEASGVDDVNFDAAEKCCTMPENYLMIVGNPLRRSGRFYDMFTKATYGYWQKKKVSYDECSQVDRDIAERDIETYGRNSAYVQPRIFGEFPSMDADDVGIAYDLVRAAMDRELDDEAQALARSTDPRNIQVGVDCARYGVDEFAIAARVGPEIKPLRTWRKTSGVDMVQKVIETVKSLVPDVRDQGPEQLNRFQVQVLIVVDETGLGGSGLVDPLIQTYQFHNVHGVNNNMRPRDEKKYANWDDECWLEHLPQFLEYAKLPDDEVLLNELTTRKYEFTGKMALQRRLESKRQLRARGLGSPSRAESVMLATPNIKLPTGVREIELVGW